MTATYRTSSHSRIGALAYLDELFESLENENERDQDGENLLREAAHESDQKGAFERDGHDRYDADPHPDPEPRREKRQAVGQAELEER